MHWHARFYIAARSIYTFFFCQWQSRADRVLTLNINIRLPLFWSTSSWARTQPHVLAWRMGVIIAIVEPRSKIHKRCLAHKFSKILENKGPWLGVFNPHPPGRLSPSEMTPTLWCYVDSDWAGCPDFRQSFSGFVFMLLCAVISWGSKCQLVECSLCAWGSGCWSSPPLQARRQSQRSWHTHQGLHASRRLLGSLAPHHGPLIYPKRLCMPQEVVISVCVARSAIPLSHIQVYGVAATGSGQSRAADSEARAHESSCQLLCTAGLPATAPCQGKNRNSIFPKKNLIFRKCSVCS